MFDTSLFKTRTEFVPRVAPAPYDSWPVGLDIGYSGVKGFSPNKVFCFPSYAKKVPEGRRSIKDVLPQDISYRDKDGLWDIGEMAYAGMGASGVSESETELYGRNRYYSPMFLVIARAGLGIAMMGNGLGSPKNGKCILQTGLPPKYERTDSRYLKDVLSGRHQFELKVGRDKWESFDFEISADDIHIMPQPLGALLSTCIGSDGKQVAAARRYFNSNVVVADPGFGTFDVYTLRHGNVTGFETFPELGMREVFSRTCSAIMDAYGTEVTVAGMQNLLAEGTVNVLDRKNMSREKKGFSRFLESSLHSVCSEAVEKISDTHDYMCDTDIIITTGGTSEAWKDDFEMRFRAMAGLEVIPANVNDPGLSNIYSNVRGYYFNIASRSAGKRI